MSNDELTRIDPVELGKRIAGARKARRISQEEVAQRLGVSRPIVVDIEKGNRRARPAEIEQLAQMFGRTVHELMGKRPFVAEFAPQFRMPASSQILEEVRTEAVENFRRVCEDYLALEKLMEAPLPKRYPEPIDTHGMSVRVAAEEIAIQERTRLGLGDGPLLNLDGVLETQVGLRIFVLPMPRAAKIAGMFVYTEELGGCILVNGVHPSTRRRYSAAHEYAHFLCDRYQSEITVLEEYTRKPRTEQFADLFAASFLMPAIGLRQRFRAVLQKQGDFTVADLCLLADQYHVSVEAFARRLEALECVRSGAWARLSNKGFQGRRGQEMLGIASHKEPKLRLPERFRRLAVAAYEAEKITEGELARFLRCARVEARVAVEELTRAEEVSLDGFPLQLELDLGERMELAPAERE